MFRVWCLFFLIFKIAAAHEKVLIYWSGLGEYQWAQRLEYVLAGRGHEVRIQHIDPLNCHPIEKPLLKDFLSPQELKKFEHLFQPTLILELNRSMHSTYRTKRVLFIHDHQRALSYYKNKQLRQYDLIIGPEVLITYLKEKIPGLRCLAGYPSHHNTPSRILEPRSVFNCGFFDHKTPKPDKNDQRGSGNLLYVLQALDRRHLLSFYGKIAKWQNLDQSYRGLLPFEADSIYHAIQKAGICLVLHSDHHIMMKFPTARIFEAAAASAYIISDKHPFVVKYFGDTVFYIDRNAPGDQIAKQIFRHIAWIKSNPIEAQKKAQAAHAIFARSFTLEQFIDQLFENLGMTAL
jgi:glycosyltransferase involved in cell wall biosynthesis